MNTVVTPTNILFVLGLLGTLFTVYNYFRNPQIKSEQTEAITTLQVLNLQKDVTAILSNHLPHIDQRLNGMDSNLGTMGKDIVRLATVIDERIPKKRIR